MCLFFKSELEAIRKNENISLRIMRYCMFCFLKKWRKSIVSLCSFPTAIDVSFLKCHAKLERNLQPTAKMFFKWFWKFLLCACVQISSCYAEFMRRQTTKRRHFCFTVSLAVSPLHLLSFWHVSEWRCIN